MNVLTMVAVGCWLDFISSLWLLIGPCVTSLTLNANWLKITITRLQRGSRQFACSQCTQIALNLFDYHTFEMDTLLLPCDIYLLCSNYIQVTLGLQVHKYFSNRRVVNPLLSWNAKSIARMLRLAKAAS